jgi:hypothetical protein
MGHTRFNQQSGNSVIKTLATGNNSKLPIGKSVIIFELEWKSRICLIRY